MEDLLITCEEVQETFFNTALDGHKGHPYIFKANHKTDVGRALVALHCYNNRNNYTII
jgi:hypothetical protein